MKYLDLAGLTTAINNIKAWTIAQLSKATIPHSVIMAAYNGAEGDNMTSLLSVADFTAAYNALVGGKTLILPSSSGYAVPNAVWTYVVGSTRVIGLSMIDIFGGSELQSATFEFSASGTTVTLSVRSVMTITTT